MPRFRFRLEASLSLAEQVLENAQRILAQEMRRLEELKEIAAQQAERWMEALAGQREACRMAPERLGEWQVYSLIQLQRLRGMEEDVAKQQGKVDQARQVLVSAHQECEKFRRLKAKRWQIFRLAEQRREQKVLDEAGQVLYWRKNNAVV